MFWIQWLGADVSTRVEMFVGETGLTLRRLTADFGVLMVGVGAALARVVAEGLWKVRES